MFVDRILEVIESSVVPLGYEVIDIETDKNGLIRVYVDLFDGVREINLKDCELITKQLLYLFPVEGISYERLEVSSPGVDRKLTKAHHFERFVGAMVKLKFRDLVAGKKNYVGLLGKSIKKKSMDMIKKETPSNNNIVEETSSIFFILEKGTDGTDRIEFGIEQLEYARLIEEISLKGKPA